MTTLDTLRAAYDSARCVVAARRHAVDLLGRLTQAYGSGDAAAHRELEAERRDVIALSMTAVENLMRAERACLVAEIRLDVGVIEAMRDPSPEMAKRLQQRRFELAAIERGKGAAA